MKKTKQFQKGKHFYIKSGKKKEIYTIKEKQKQETEFDKDYQEVYVDQFKFEISEKSFKIFFGKQIFGIPQIKLKRIIRMGPKTAKKFLNILKNIIK